MNTIWNCYCFRIYFLKQGLHSNGTHDLSSWQKMSKFSTFFKKMFNSYVYVSLDNDTMKISVGNLVCKSPYFRKYNEIINIS